MNKQLSSVRNQSSSQSSPSDDHRRFAPESGPGSVRLPLGDAFAKVSPNECLEPTLLSPTPIHVPDSHVNAEPESPKIPSSSAPNLVSPVSSTHQPSHASLTSKLAFHRRTAITNDASTDTCNFKDAFRSRRISTSNINSSTVLDSPTPLGIEAPSTLDCSPVEEYNSSSLLGERVAVSLERLGKKTLEFPDGVEEGHEMSAREALIPLIVDSMIQHRDDPKVSDRALTTLRRLTMSARCRQRIGRSGGIGAIVAMLLAHSSKVRIQTQGLLTLGNLAFRDQHNKEIVLKCGGVKVIVDALSLHTDVEHIQAWGCLAIRNITNCSEGAEVDVNISVIAGAVEVLLAALEFFPDSQVVQHNATVALVNIAINSSFGMERIRNCDGIQVLIRTMKCNVRSQRLCDVILSLVKAIVEDEHNREIFGRLSGIEAITTIMDAHRGHTGIQVKGCAAFRYLAFLRNNREIMGKCGAIRSIIAAMNDVKAATPESAAYFLKALSNSTYDSVANKTLAGQLGAVQATLKTMSVSEYKGYARTVEDSCRLLRNLTDGVIQNHRMMMKHKGMVIVLDVARKHGQQIAGVAEHVTAIFVNMSSNRAFASQLSEGSGEIQQLAKHLKEAHVGNERVEKQVTDLIKMLKVTESSASAEKNGGLRYRDSSNSLKPIRSLHRSLSSRDEHGTRVQRLRSLPLPMMRHRTNIT